MNDFSTFDIAKALRIPQPRLREWVDKGFIDPTFRASGHGTKAVFNRDAVYSVALFRRLIDYGFSRTVAGDFVRGFSDQVKKEKGRVGYPDTFYIMFREPEKSDKSDVMRLGPGEWKLDIENGYIDWGASNSAFKDDIEKDKRDHPEYHVKDKNWKVLLIVNFDFIRKEVDRVL